MPRILLSILVTFVIFFVIPFPAYALASVIAGIEPPEGASPAVFMLSVTIQKLGHATVFVLMFWCARSVFASRWTLYAALWFMFFCIDEIGLAIGPTYGWAEAIAGIAAEAVYFPLAAFVISRLLTRPGDAPEA